jgi:transcriptional regulator GlxA family with amidase domain
MLLAADRTATVVAVAFACGFSNPGHFARDYRQAFGELPSATLAGARAWAKMGGAEGGK